MHAARMPWLVAVLFVTLATTAAAPVRTGPATGRIAGHVRDGQGAPIAHAQVFVVGTALSAITDTSGAFLAARGPGRHRHRASRADRLRVRRGRRNGAGGGNADAQLHPGERPRCEATRRGQGRRAAAGLSRSRDEERRAGDAQGRARLRRQRRRDRRGSPIRGVQHRGVQCREREPVPGRIIEPLVDLLDRRGRGLVQQRAPVPEPGRAATGGRGPARGAGELFPVSVSGPQRIAPVRRVDGGGAVPLGTGPPTGPDRAPGPPRPDAGPAAQQPRVPDRRVGLDGHRPTSCRWSSKPFARWSESFDRRTGSPSWSTRARRASCCRPRRARTRPRS